MDSIGINPKKSQKKTQIGRTNWVSNKIIGYSTYFKLVNGLKWGLLTEKGRKLNNKIRKSGNYTALSNEIVNDSRLNLRSLGLFLYMWSKPDNWNFTISNIAKARNVGREQILTALQELKKIGYVQYEKLRDGTGIYYLSDRIDIQDPKSENPTLASYSQSPLPKNGKPKVGFSHSSINTIRNNRDIYFHDVQKSDEEEMEKWEKINQLLLQIQMRKSKNNERLESLNQARRDNQLMG